MSVFDRENADLASQDSARNVLATQQAIAICIMVAGCITWFYLEGINALFHLVSCFTILTGAIFVYSVLLLMLTIQSNKNHFSKSVRNMLNESEAEWPVYTILVPLYKEALLIDQLVSSLSALEYPHNKLDIILLSEADDQETIDAIKRHSLPPYFRLFVVPAGYPRTKPRACNLGLVHARGEYLVIYDAEDRPEPDQLKKVLSVFRQNSDAVFCIQCHLNYYNVRQNLLTRLFTLEYSFWFDLMLTGLSISGSPVPLGGTSNHFRTENLRRLGGWDAYNVTEDCDLGMRIARAGYQTVVIDSTTWEEANSHLQNWIRQRSRWIKGYIQTYFVHMRHPVGLFQEVGMKKFLSFQLMLGAAPLLLLCAPFLWIMPVVVYFRSTPPTFNYHDAPAFIPLVLYMAAVLFFGFCGALVRHNYDLLSYALLMPGYYALQSYAAWKGFYQLIAKTHYWEKTEHGLWQSSIEQ